MKTKILIGVIGKGNGGMSTYAVNLFKLLDNKEFICTFLSTDPHPFFETEILEAGGKIVVIPPRNKNPLGHRKAIRALLKKTKFDACHIHLSTASNICPLEEAKKAGIPVIIAHTHSAKIEGGKLASIMHNRNRPKLKKLGITLLACSEAAGKFTYGDAKFTVVNNAVDVVRFSFNPKGREKIRSQYGIENKFVMGHVGRLAPVKNHEFLFKLLGKLTETEPESVLLLAGDGPLLESLKEKVAELGLKEKVIFAGNVKNPEEYMMAMDCMVLPSLFEGFPLTVLEAVGTGLPCFVSDTVTREVGISPLVSFFSLQDDLSGLAEKLLAARGAPRSSQRETLQQAGFEATTQAEKMMNRYRKARNR